jgi:DNA-binding CsgD family transcriptional regulator
MLEGGSIAASELPGPRFPVPPPTLAQVARTGPGAVGHYGGPARAGSTAGAVTVDATLVRHWRQSAGHPIDELHRGVAALLVRSEAAVAVLDCLPFGVVVVDHAGTMLVVSRRAEQILAQQDGLATSGAKLTAPCPMDTARLHRLIARTWRLAHGPGPYVSDGLQLARPSGRKALVVRIVPLRPRIDALVVLVCDPESRTPGEQSVLHQLYRLTRTEARLVATLAQGERLEDAARELGVTLGTCRTYLKRVFHKMGVSRQADLMRLVLSGPTQFSSN